MLHFVSSFTMDRPLLLSTWSFGQRGHAAAWPALGAGGAALDAVEQACTAVEDDPDVDSVGYGGLPDREGEMSLDGCIMLGPGCCGSVAGIRRHRHPVAIARHVMERTNHRLLVGEAADRFAESCGHVAEPLLSPAAREAWKHWRAKPNTIDQSMDRSLRPIDTHSTGRLFDRTDAEERWNHYDTVGVLCLDARGDLAGACSTSGTPFKLPGRVGDSPIIGHGLYVDSRAGAATATGTGELIMDVCGSFLAVELMRRGASPLEAICEVLQRIVETAELLPHHQVAMIALQPQGAWASAALRLGYRTSVRCRNRDEVVEPEFALLPEMPGASTRRAD